MNLSRTGNEQYGNRNQSKIPNLLSDPIAITEHNGNKKETDTWFQALGAQMPLLGGTKYGFIRTITQFEEGSQAKNKVDIIGISDGSNLDISYSREMDPVAALEKQVKLLRKQKEYWKSQTKRTDGKKADSKAVRKLVLQPISNKKAGTAKAVPTILVGVAGFEPAASWTRTMRDTKLRHTPIALIL